MVVAEEAEVGILMVELERAPERAATIVGALTTAGATSTSMPPSRPMLEMTRALGATVIVLGRAAQVDDDIVTQASMLHEEGVRVRTMSMFYEQWLGKLPIGELERVSLLFDIGELHAAGYARVKRLLDLALATVGLLALAAVTPFVLVGDLIANRGPLMFRQPRTGRGGRRSRFSSSGPCGALATTTRATGPPSTMRASPASATSSGARTSTSCPRS